MQVYIVLLLDIQKYILFDNIVVIDSVSLIGKVNGNLLFKFIKFNQLDLIGEWYFFKIGLLIVVLFDKEFKDIIVKQFVIVQFKDGNGMLVDFMIILLVNGVKGYVCGIEIVFQCYFDMLFGWLFGFGVQVNYIYVDSKIKFYNLVLMLYCSGISIDVFNFNFNINGCDIDGCIFGNLLLINLFKNVYNLVVFYDYGLILVCLVYSWCFKYLQGVNVNGINGGDGQLFNVGGGVVWVLLMWSDVYGQVDVGVIYCFSDNFSFSLEGQNLNNVLVWQLMQQYIGYMICGVNYMGCCYFVQVSYIF